MSDKDISLKIAKRLYGEGNVEEVPAGVLVKQHEEYPGYQWFDPINDSVDMEIVLERIVDILDKGEVERKLVIDASGVSIETERGSIKYMFEKFELSECICRLYLDLEDREMEVENDG